MKVYVLFRAGMGYPNRIIGVYKSKALAQKARTAFTFIEKWEVIEQAQTPEQRKDYIEKAKRSNQGVRSYYVN